MVNINDNYELFDDLNKSLEYANNIKPFKVDNKIVINFFWRVPLEFGRKQVLPVISAIVNNYDLNKDNLEINLWSNIDLSDNEYLKDIKRFINIKIWDPIEEIKGTFLEENIEYYKSNIIYDDKNWIAGDFFRLLCLYKYGGFYFDMDVLVLRDLSPLNNIQFIYQWGTSGTTESEPNIFYNGAIMRLDKNSTASEKLLIETLNVPSSVSTTWSSNIYSKINDDKLFYLPCAWFNTEWARKDENSGLQAFKKMDGISLYEGAFTWHWHNGWDKEIEDGSKFQIFEEMMYNKLNEILLSDNER